MNDAELGRIYANQDKIFSKVNKLVVEATKANGRQANIELRVTRIEEWEDTHPSECPVVIDRREKTGRTARLVGLIALVFTVVVGGFKILDIVAAAKGWW